MKKNTKIQALSMLLTLLLCASVLAACKGNEQEGAGEMQGTDAPEQSTEAGENTTEAPETEESTEESTEGTAEAGTTEPEPEKVAYAVTVIGSDGNARQGAVVRFYQGEEQVTMVATGADGTANAQLLPGTYTVVIDNILGEQYETEGCTVTPETPTLTVRLFGLPAAGEEIYAYSPAADDYVAYKTGRIGEGEYYVKLTANDMTYLLFVASRGGVFRISADADKALSIGYFGSTSFVLTESVAVEENNAIEVEVYDDMVYNYAFVIGIAAEDAAVSACNLRVEYVGEREATVEDLPWNDLMPSGTLAAFTKPAGTLKKFDVTDDSLQVVYNEQDGYYHVGSAQGPVLMLNLGNDSPYMDALTTVCGTMRLGVYVYDEQGNFVSKDSYNELIYAYNAVSDGGYYPLDRTLADAMRTIGAYMGWYDASSPMSLFGAAPVVPEHAHLFACVYVQ
jgi:predicted small secreted protein